MIGEEVASLVFKKVQEYLIHKGNGSPNWFRINSLATDIYKVMNVCHRLLGVQPETSRVFYILCDSYSLQLLIMDILLRSGIRSTFKTVSEIISFFNSAPLQLNRLQKYQVEIYHKTSVLLVSVITRWGLQFKMLRSVLKCRQALERQALNIKKDDRGRGKKASIASTLLEPTFWADLDELI